MSLMRDRALEYLVDKKGEGGLVCELDRSPMLDQPTLIIGLGGTGVDAMLHAKYIIQRKFVAAEGKKKPGRLAFIAVDTDDKDFKRKRVGDVRVDASEKVLIDEPNLASYMKNPELIPQDYLRDWLCQGINADAITDGAGGIRQCGRFMLINKAQNLIQRITQACAETWGAGTESGAAFPADTKFNVYLLTGVSGGTGSGTFLDAAYLIREVIKNQVHRDVKMRGFIFMPDVNLCKVKDEGTRGYIPVNGYAALRELDFWMNAERGRNFVQQYTATVSVNTNEKPFDMCFLVSPNGAMESDYENCMQTTGEAIMNILTAPVDNAMGFDSFITNLGGMMLGAALKTSYSGNYVYASMGMDEQRIQLDSLANYLAYYLLTKVNKLFDREPIKEEVEALFSKELKLDSKRGLLRIFDKSIPARPFNDVVRSLEDFRSAIADYKRSTVLDDSLLDTELRTWVAQCEATYNMNQNDILEECLTALKQQIEKRFVDIQYGPYYAHRMLHNTEVGKPDIIKRLEEERNVITAFLSTADDREDALKRQAEEALGSARRNKHVPLMAKPKYNDYVEAVYRYYDHIRYAKFAKVAYQFYTRMLSETVDYNNQIVERFTSLLEHLTKVFKSNSDIITNVDHDGMTHTWNIGNFDQIKEKVDHAMKEYANTGKEDALVTAFLAWMMHDRHAWVGDNSGLGSSFSHFVSEKFRDLMNLTMEESYERCMQSERRDGTLEEYMKLTVLPKLKMGAKVLYTPDDMLSPLGNSPSRAMITVPSTATRIYKATTEYVTENSLQCDVVASKRQGSLFWFQASMGLPMYAHDALRTYQHNHDVYGTVDNHRGRYLKMSPRENWLEMLPPLMPEATWAYAKYGNAKWEKRNAATRAMFMEAWKNKLVQPLHDGSTVYALGKVDAEQYKAILAASPLDAEARAKIMKEGAAAAASMKLKVSDVEAYVKNAEAFADTGWVPDGKVKFKNDVFTKLCGGVMVTKEEEDPEKRMIEILAENLLWTPDMANKLAEQLKLKRELNEVIRLNRVYLELADAEKNEREDFANALIYGLYRAAAPRVFQLDGSDANIPTCMLMTIADYKLAPVTDPFYALFRKYVTYDDTLKGNMKKICTVRENKMNSEMNTGNTARYDRYVATVKGIDNAMAMRLQQIDMDVTFQNQEIREFYQAMRASFANFLGVSSMGGL